MRAMLLTSAVVLGLAGLPALAQTPADPAPATDPGVATDTPQATGQTATQPKRRHHVVRKTADSDGTETFAHEPGTGMSGPASQRASNIDGSDSHSDIAPHLPQPAGGESAGPWHYLHAAEQALAMKHTGEAQQALEMAETRLLDRSTPVDRAGVPDDGPVIQQVSAARQALGHNDLAGARQAVQAALSHDPHQGNM